MYLISDSVPQSARKLDSALARTDTAFRPSTSAAHLLYLRTYVVFLVFLKIPFLFSIYNLLIFGEYLYNNNISYKVIEQYFSSLHTSASFYGLNVEAFSHPVLSRLIWSISIISQFSHLIRVYVTSEPCISFPFHVTSFLTPSYSELFS